MPAEYMGIEPVYAATEGLSSKTIEKIMKKRACLCRRYGGRNTRRHDEKTDLCEF